MRKRRTPEEDAAYRKQYRLDHHAEELARGDKWKKENPDKVAAIKKKRKPKEKEYHKKRSQRPEVRKKNREDNRVYAADHYDERIPYMKPYLAVYSQTPKGRFSSYKGSAKKRGIAFLLNFNEFTSFWQLPCDYCDSPIETIGLDRMDNDGIYILSNVTPCCEPCNTIKRAKYTYEEMKTFIGPALKKAWKLREKKN